MVLVTGAAGFIGSHLVRGLLSRNMRVIGIDNMNDYYDPDIKDRRIDELCEDDNFIFHQINVENRERLGHVFENYNFCNIVHLAARAGVRHSVANPVPYFSTNVGGTLNLLELMKKHKKRQLTMASTSSVYAGHGIPFNEVFPPSARSPYAASKVAAESLASCYAYLYDMNISVLRLFTVYGPDGRPDMCYSKFIKAIQDDEPITIHGDGSQKRDFTYIDDVVNGIVKTFVHDGFDIFNLGTGKTTSINDLITKLEDLMGKKAKVQHDEFKPEDMTTTMADNTKAKTGLSWEPKFSIDDGLKRTIQ